MRTDLKDARIALGLTQQEVADAIGRDQGAVSRYETGATEPDKAIAPALAKVLRMPILDVLYAPVTRKRRKAA